MTDQTQFPKTWFSELHRAPSGHQSVGSMPVDEVDSFWPPSSPASTQLNGFPSGSADAMTPFGRGLGSVPVGLLSVVIINEVLEII